MREEGPDALGDGRAEPPATEDEEDAAGATMIVQCQASSSSMVVVEMAPERAALLERFGWMRVWEGAGGEVVGGGMLKRVI
jgi:hypothetical protein